MGRRNSKGFESAKTALVYRCVVLSLVVLPFVNVVRTQVGASQQPPPPTAKEVLLASNDACIRIGSIIYDFESEVTNGGKIVSLVTATVYQARANVPDAGYVPGKYFVS